MKVTKPAGRKVLYLCPSAMVKNVVREVQMWAKHRSPVVLGGQSKAARRFLIDIMLEHPEYVVVCNYEAWVRDKGLIEDLIEVEFDMVILDEAHNLKDRKSSRFRGVQQILQGTMEPINKAPIRNKIPFVVPMTGTPILNKPQDLFTLLMLVDPFHFYNEYYFLNDYCVQDWETKKWKFAPGGVESLFKKFPNLFLRRTKEQAGIILPPKSIINHQIEVDETAYPMQGKARQEMRKWGSIMLDPDKKQALTAMAQIAVFTRLRQIETWPAGMSVKDEHGDVILSLGPEYGESQKLDYIIRWENGDINDWDGLIPEVTRNHTTGDGERTVVFSQFKEPLREIQRRCEAAGYRAVILDGDTPSSVKESIAMDFDLRHTPDPATSKYDVVLCNYRVGGVGLNFTAATQMIVLDEEWNPGKRDQAYDRIHRMGQDKPVTIHVLRTEGTIDNWLASIIEEKEAMLDDFHTTGDSMALAAFDALKGGLI